MPKTPKLVKHKPLSTKSVATLRYFSKNEATYDTCRSISQVTLWCLLNRGYLVLANKKILLSTTGQQVLTEYSSSAANWRTAEGELTVRVANLLQAARTALRKEA